MSTPNSIRSVLIASLLTFSAHTAFARFEPVTCNNSFTPEQEISEGNKVAAEIYKQMPVLREDDPETRYLQQVGARLVRSAPLVRGVTSQWPFTFHVVASKDINAFALPGGAVFVNLATLQAAENEAELAGVMAHEISHVVLRHSTCNLGRQRNKSLLYGLGEIGSAILLGDSRAGQVAQAGLGIGQSLDFLHMSRGDEEQADLLGVNILADAGYDPHALPRFFEILRSKTGDGGSAFFSDHPNPANRTQYIEAEIATLAPVPNPTLNTPAFVRARNEAENGRVYSAEEVKAGQWKTSGLYSSGPGQTGYRQTGQTGQAYPQTGQNGQGYPQSGQGYPQPGTRPSNDSRDPRYSPPGGQSYPQDRQSSQADPQRGPSAPALTYTQLGLAGRMVRMQVGGASLNAPAGWRVNQATVSDADVSVTPPGGFGSFGVSYGVLVGEEAQPQNADSEQSALASVHAFIVQRFLSGDPTLSQASETATFSYSGGRTALGTYLRGRSPIWQNGQQQPERDWVVTLTRPDGDISFLVFVAPERDFDRLKPTFDRMLSSFRAQ